MRQGETVNVVIPVRNAVRRLAPLDDIEAAGIILCSFDPEHRLFFSSRQGIDCIPMDGDRFCIPEW